MMQTTMKHLAPVLGAALFMALVPIHGAAGEVALEPTPRTGTGPFYPPDDSLPYDNDLTDVGELGRSAGIPEGEVIEIVGTVKDTQGRPVPGAALVIWQTDIHGKYDHPKESRTDREGKPLPIDPHFQYWGKTVADAEGRYHFRTIVPGSYGRLRHVHFQITHPEYRPLATEMQFAGDPVRENDFVTGHLSESRRSRLVVELEEAEGGEGPRVARFPIVLQP